MSAPFSTPSASPAHPLRALWRRAALLALLGTGCTCAAIWIGNAARLDKTAKLDIVGKPVIGTAESLGADSYRLRYVHPVTGAIYSGIFRGKPPVDPHAVGKTSVRLVYNPSDPGSFQEAGRSHLPGAAAVALVVGAILCAARARRMFLNVIPRTPTTRP